MHLRRIFFLCFLCLSGTCLIAGNLYAAPPFVTDDPGTAAHIELDFFSQISHSRGGTTGDGAGLEADYGILPNVELEMMPQIAFAEGGKDSGIGYGDMQFGVKYRFLDQAENEWWPDIAIDPVVNVPTGNARYGLGAGHSQEFLPVWLQKDFGRWQVYGGGGYWFNSGSGDRNYWFSGIVLQYAINDHLTFGGEVFHQTAAHENGVDSSGFNLGGSYGFNSHYNLLFSAGRGVQNAANTNQFSGYLALQVLY